MRARELLHQRLDLDWRRGLRFQAGLVAIIFGLGLQGCLLVLAVPPASTSRNQVAPTGLSYSSADSVYVYNDASSVLSASISNNSPTVSGAVSSYEISPDLNVLTGLDFNSSTGVISGKASLTLASTTFTITARNSAGSAQTTIQIRTVPGFEVNDTADASDAATGDSACSTAGAVCTLRAAIEQLNTFSSGTTRVVKLSDATYSIGSGLNLARDIEILGASRAGTIVDGAAGAYRMFTVTAGAPHFKALTLQNSVRSTVWTNAAVTIRLTNVFVKNVHDASGDAAIFLSNGSSSLNVDGSVFEDSASGGAQVIACYPATCSISNSVFRSNYSVNNGGAGFSTAVVFQGNGSIDRSEFTDNRNNHTGASAGAIGVRSGTVTISNTTFSENRGGAGGIIGILAGTLTISSSTFYGNISTATGGGTISRTGGTVQILNSIFENNTNTADSISRSCQGTLVSLGYNLMDTPSSDCANLNTGTDTYSGAAVLGTLQSANGGNVKFYPLLGGSQAIGRGPLVSAGSCIAVLGSTGSVDQRGSARPGSSSKTNCDIGAYETQ